eukprot:g26703.t1
MLHHRIGRPALAGLICALSIIPIEAAAAESLNRQLLPDNGLVVVELQNPASALEHPVIRNVWAEAAKSAELRRFVESPDFDRARHLVGVFEQAAAMKWPVALERLTAGGVAASFQAGKTQELAVVISAESAATMQQTVKAVREKLLEQIPEAYRKRVVVLATHRNHDYYRFGKAAYAVVGKRLLFANTEPQLLKMVDRLIDAKRDDDKSPTASGTKAASLKVQLNVDAIRNLPDFRKALKTPADNAGGVALLGGWLDLMRRSKRLDVELTLAGQSLDVRVSVPVGSKTMPSEIAGFFATPETGSAAPLLNPPRTIYSASWCRDYRALWENRRKLLTADAAREMEEGDKRLQQQLSVIGAKTLFSTLFTELDTKFRVVVVRPEKDDYRVNLKNRFPAGAIAVKLRNESLFQEQAGSLFKAIGFLATVGEAKMITKNFTYHGAELRSLRFRDDRVSASKGNRIRFQFSPTYGIAKGHVVAGSTPEVVRAVIDELHRLDGQKSSASGTRVTTEIQSLSLQEAANALRDYRAPVVPERAVTERENQMSEAQKTLERFRPQTAWQSYFPLGTNPWNVAKVMHLFRRAAFGASWETAQAAVDSTPAEVVAGLIRGGDGQDAFEAEVESLMDGVMESQDPRQLQSVWLYRMLHSPHPLKERMTLFWHNHFATSNAKVADLRMMQRQHESLRTHALGHFGDMLQEMTRDPAMILWLDSNTNKKGKPNENYAREVFELFSLGVGNYTETDIKEAARALTGWDVRDRRAVFNPGEFDSGEKTILGRTGRWGAGDVVRIALEQPACARFLTRKIFRELVSDTVELPDRLLEPLADEFRIRNYDIAWLVDRMLRSWVFYSAVAYQQKIKSPVDFLIGTVRLLEGRVGPLPLATLGEKLGQILYYPPSVKGWDGGDDWINSTTLLTRQNVSFQLTSGQGLGRRSDPGELVRRYRVQGDRRVAEFFLKLFLQRPDHEALPRLLDYVRSERKRLKSAFYSDKAIDQRLARGTTLIPINQRIHPMTVSRRDFLAASSGVAVGLGMPDVFQSAAAAAPALGKPGGKETVLVVVQLSGGNDGLNTVIPYRHPEYIRRRPKLKQPAARVKKLGKDDLALHPEMSGFAKLWEDSKLSIVQGVGYPNSDRSHFSSMDIWHKASRSKEQRYGWLGRTLPAIGGAGAAMHVGGDEGPLALFSATGHAPSLKSLAEYKLQLGKGADVALKRRLIEGFAGDRKAPARSSNALLDRIRQSAKQTYESSRRIQKVAESKSKSVDYPKTGLGGRMQLIAKLINAEVPERIFYTSLDGFDTHAAQAVTHANLLREFSDAIASFQQDLTQRGNQKRVVVMTFSEFGRRVRENGSDGTDHGSGSQMFFIGDAVKPGLIGKHPRELWLKNGTHLTGELVPIKGLTSGEIKRLANSRRTFPILLVDKVYKRYFVPHKHQVEKAVFTTDLAPDDTFRIKHRGGYREPGPSILGTVRVLTPFSKFGRRTVLVKTSRGNQKIVQGVTAISPQYVLVRGITHDWEFGVATSSIPADQIDAMIRQVTDQTKPGDRMAIARFYIAASMFPQADAELKSIARDFPDYKKKVEEVQFKLRQFQGTKIVAELRRRKAAGQHQLVYQSCKQFPRNDISAALRREVTMLLKDYDDAKQRAEKAAMLLGELQSKLTDKDTIAAVAPMRSTVRDELNYETLPRLQAFLNLSVDESLTPKEKLALAYSGWIVGSANATKDLDLTIRMWNSRYLLSEYLRTVNTIQRRLLLEKLKAAEGISPVLLGRMIPYLPPVIETPGVTPGKPATITVAGRAGRTPIRYSVLLPSGYRPYRSYPMIVALRPHERTCEAELEWWGGRDERTGQSHRHGYIVIAPEYAEGKTGGYDYDTTAHAVVIESIRDARKRFRVDSDRVFLSGHGSGGDAAFDIGMSHPDLFAGVIPINGISDKYCRWYYTNTQHLPFYVVDGELARKSMQRNGREMNRMMYDPLGGKFDVIYCQYVGRGYESFYEEIESIFEWMGRLKRSKYISEINARVLRPSDDRFYWVRASGFPAVVNNNNVLVEGTKRTAPRAMPMQVRVARANRIMINSGALHHTLWLTPDIIDFDQPVEVRKAGRRKFKGVLKRDIEVLLEDLRVRGDREKPYWARLEIEGPKRSFSMTTPR